MNEKVLKNPLARPDSEDELNSSADSSVSEHMLEYTIADIDTSESSENSESSVVSEGNRVENMGTIPYTMYFLAVAYLSIRLYINIFEIAMILYAR